MTNERDLRLQQLQTLKTDMFVCDGYTQLTDSAASGFDLYTFLAGSSADYTSMVGLYGMIRFDSVLIKFMPFSIYSTTASDKANGFASLIQGVYNVAPSGGTATLNDPGSITIHNCVPFTLSLKIVGGFIPSDTTNTQTSLMPKVLFTYYWNTASTTQSSKGLVHVRVLFSVKARLM